MEQSKYFFYPNPHDFYAWTKCPKCDEKTKLRKFCLLIHYKDESFRSPRLLSVRMDCKFCTSCELIIKKKSEIEVALQKMVANWNLKFDPKNYFVFGTMEMNDWKQGQKASTPPQNALENVSVFKDVLDFEIQPAGWYFSGDK